jgi:hypothetical protein
MPTKDPWEEILELARRIDDGVAARRGVNPTEAMELVRAVMAFQERLASGAPAAPLRPEDGVESISTQEPGGQQ